MGIYALDSHGTGIRADDIARGRFLLQFKGISFSFACPNHTILRGFPHKIILFCY